MALSGVHITFGYSAGGNIGGTLLVYKATSSQTMASATTSTVTAPAQGTSFGDIALQPTCSISASAPIYYALGPTPDATSGARRYFDPTTVAAGSIDVYCDPGDKLAWILVP